MERALKTSLIILTIFLSATVFAPAVTAETSDQDKCDNWTTYFWTIPAAKCLFVKTKEALPDIDLRATIMGIIDTVMAEAIPFATLHRSMTETQGCVLWMKDQGWINLPINIPAGETAISPPADGCDDLNVGYGPERYAYNGRVGGSVLGVAYFVNDVAEHERIPVNLAYYAQDMVKRTPILNNTALAESPDFTKTPILEYVLDVWRVVRNIAYGILAVVMLFAGIMIMLRRKISPQAVVTIQNSLPKIALAVVLITFSYPIGALIASLVWPLASLPYQLFNDINTSAGLATEVGPGLGTVGVIIGLMSIVGAGGIVMLLLMFMMLVYFLLWIYAFVKALIIYFKIVISIVSAPLEFAVGAIPGAESSVVNWFKRVGAYIASVPAIFFLMHFSFHIMLRALAFPNLEEAAFGVVDFGGIGSSFLIFLIAPFLMIYLAWMAVKVPDKIEGFIMGNKRR